MKHGIDNLLKILEDYCTASKSYASKMEDVGKNFTGEYGKQMAEQYTSEMKAKANTQKTYFETQIRDTIKAIAEDRAKHKYVSDAGFATVLHIITSGGEKLDTETLRNLVKPYLDDHISVKSVSAILRQQGRDPEALGVVPSGDPLEIVSGIEKNFPGAFSTWDGTPVSMDSSPSVIGYQLQRAASILDGVVSETPGSVSI